MRKLLAIAALAAVVATPALAIKLYPTLADAQAKCKSPVVWLNVKSMIYHLQGSKDFGSTKEGAYVCQKAADRDGARPAANGQ